jgi:hypothetical protein
MKSAWTSNESRYVIYSYLDGKLRFVIDKWCNEDDVSLDIYYKNTDMDEIYAASLDHVAIRSLHKLFASAPSVALDFIEASAPQIIWGCDVIVRVGMLYASKEDFFEIRLTRQDARAEEPSSWTIDDRIDELCARVDRLKEMIDDISSRVAQLDGRVTSHQS